MKQPRVLTLSRNYPNPQMPYLGLWVEHWMRHVADACEVRVVAPVPYCPPLPGLTDYTRFRKIPASRIDDPLRVYHPRFLIGPGTWLYQWESLGYYLGVRRLVGRLRREFPFDIIHAHMSYPDGVVAAHLGRRYGVPVIVTEHALWRPGMDTSPGVRRQTVRAARHFDFHVAVSEACRKSIAHFTGDSDRLRVIHVGVDGAVFTTTAARANSERDRNQILFVGRIHRTKGVDVLLRAMRRLADRHPELRLVLVGGGGSCYRAWRRQEAEMQELARELGLTDRAAFVGAKSPSEVAAYMRSSSVLVLPSRRESFGAVLVEALACGTPVVSTRCGGPEDIVTDEVGLLVEPRNDEALAAAIEQVMARLDDYQPERLRQYALSRFSWDRVVDETMNLYSIALANARRDRPPEPVPLSSAGW